LVQGLIQEQEEVHIPVQGKGRNYCSWRDCQPRGYTRRTTLGEVVNDAGPRWTSRTYNYCTRCKKALCIEKGCWTAYHDQAGLLIRPEDRR
jgi:hypothetical protein